MTGKPVLRNIEKWLSRKPEGEVVGLAKDNAACVVVQYFKEKGRNATVGVNRVQIDGQRYKPGHAWRLADAIDDSRGYGEEITASEALAVVRRVIALVGIVLIAVSASVSPAMAQSADEHYISGYACEDIDADNVCGPSDPPAVGRTIVVTRVDNTYAVTAQTGESGTWVVQVPLIGMYFVSWGEPEWTMYEVGEVNGTSPILIVPLPVPAPPEIDTMGQVIYLPLVIE